jgi:hypothetical protein
LRSAVVPSGAICCIAAVTWSRRKRRRAGRAAGVSNASVECELGKRVLDAKVDGERAVPPPGDEVAPWRRDLSSARLPL